MTWARSKKVEDDMAGSDGFESCVPSDDEDQRGLGAGLPRLPQLPNTLEVHCMKAIAAIIAQAVAFGLTTVAFIFILAGIPAAFTGNYHFVNIFFLSFLAYFILFTFAFLLDPRTNPVHQSPPPTPSKVNKEHSKSSRPRHEGISAQVNSALNHDQEFLDFYSSQNGNQERIMARIEEISKEVTKLMDRCVGHEEVKKGQGQFGVPTGAWCVDHPPARKELPGPFFRSVPNPAEYPPDQRCRNCVRESRPCSECLRNPNCPCSEEAAAAARIREFRLDQETQVTRLVEQTKIQKKLKGADGGEFKSYVM